MSEILFDRPPAQLTETVRAALSEDLGRGDVTSAACVPAATRGVAEFVAREPFTVAGMPIVAEVYRQLNPTVAVELSARDGDRVEAGGCLARVRGPARALLSGERVALNFLQRLCGVATLTRRYVDELTPGSHTRIADTRKTTPGLRALERHAVRCGGGFNHREDLAAGVLIKDNHIAAAGGVRQAIEAARRSAPHSLRVECEVDTLEQLEEALAAHADILLLDNFDDARVKRALELNAGRAITEASGGITYDRVRSLSALGVDFISVGALTHSAPACDIGLDWIP